MFQTNIQQALHSVLEVFNTLPSPSLLIFLWAEPGVGGFALNAQSILQHFPTPAAPLLFPYL